jgi:hypothetical protein
MTGDIHHQVIAVLKNFHSPRNGFAETKSMDSEEVRTQNRALREPMIGLSATSRRGSKNYVFSKKEFVQS